MNLKKQSDKIAYHCNKAAELAYKTFGDTDIFNYGRAYEYLMASKLGHIVADNILGDDGIDLSIKEGNNGVEYKTRTHYGYDKKGECKNVSFTYGGIARVDDYEEQVEIIRKKILKSAAHYWGIRVPIGFDIEIIYKISSEDVLKALLKKLPEKWKQKTQKDPRILISIGLKDIERYEVVYKRG